MRIDKYWADLLQILTEDENLRIRKKDMVELERTDVIEFMMHVKLFEKRIEEKLAQAQKNKER